MQVTSKEYREEQKRDLRNASHVFVYLGVISKEAQANAYVASQLEPYASAEIFQTTPFEAYYASLEDSFTKADGSFIFLPRDPDAYALFQGAVSVEIEGSITFDFEEYHSLAIKGLTIDFGDYYPTRFVVTNGVDTYEYENDSPGEYVFEDVTGEYVFEDVFNGTDYITITPLEMVGGQQRMRIMSIMFGVGLLFDNKTLISTQRKTTIDHLSNSLPMKEFSFTVDNHSKKFNKDNPNSFINFLETEQECTFEYGRELDDGSIYRVPGSTVALKSWSSNDSQAKFTCSGYLDFMGATSYRGQYRPNGITAYDLALEVLADAGVEKYRIDSYLKRITFKNPLPVATHKVCLQTIANASQSILYETRDGTINIESAFVPDITDVDIFGHTDYSENETLIEEAETVDYATLENGYTKVDGRMLFLPRNHAAALDTGYVSNACADNNGDLPSEASIEITWEAQWTFFGLEIEYDDWAIPAEAVVIGYANGAEVTRDTTDTPTSFSTPFYECDKIKVIFTKTEPGQRIHLKRISSGDISDFEITYHELSDTPVASSTDNVKDIEVHYYDFSYSDETATVSTVEVTAGENLVTFTTPYYQYTAAYQEGSGTVSILESGAYYVLLNASAAGTVQVNGKKLAISDRIHVYPVSEIGLTKAVKNQLIHSKDMANIDGEWVAEYYSNDTDYNITYRGEPAIDCDDLIYLENNFVDKNLIRVTSETLSTSTGMGINSHKISARRISYNLRG